MNNFDLRKYLAEGRLFEEDIASKAISVLKSYKGEVKGVEGYIKYLMNTSDDISSSIQAIADDLDRDKPSSDSLRRDLEKLSLAEGKLNENLQIDDIFGEYVAQWSQGNYDYDFADLKSGSVKGSLVDDFTLGPDEYDDDEYVRDYKIMRDYLLKNRSYKLSQDEKEGLSQFPVQFTLDDDGETIKADIYYSPEYLAMVDADLDEGKLNENQDDSYYIDEIKRDLEELDDKEANEYLEDLAKAILKLKR